MKNINKKLTLILVALIAMVFAGCNMFGGDDSDDEEPARQEATGIAFSKNNITIDGAEDTYLQFSVTPKEIQNKVHVDWVYDENMVSLDPDNYGVVIHPKAAGTPPKGSNFLQR